MCAFWAKGYEATTLSDLLAATGLQRGSLYQAFGDKHSLFIQALNRYLTDMRRQENEALEQAETPLQGIKSVLHLLVDMAGDKSGTPKGCMAINSLIEMVPHDTEVQKIMEDHMRRIRSTMEKAVMQAQATGEIAKKRSAEVITALMITFMAGLVASVHGPLDSAEAHELVDLQLAACCS